MASQIDRPVQTFTIGFEDARASTSALTRALVAERIGADHHEFVVQPERSTWWSGSSGTTTSRSATRAPCRRSSQRAHPRARDRRPLRRRRRRGFRRVRALPGRARGPPLRRTARAGARSGARDVGRAPAGRCGAGPAALQRFAGVAELGLPDAYRSWISYVQDPERDALLDGRRDAWAIEDYRRLVGHRRAPIRSTGCSTSTFARICSTTCW